LWAMGPIAARSATDLVDALDDPVWVVRWASARALGAVVSDGIGETAASALARALRDDDSRVCEAAAFALEQIGPAAGSALAATSDVKEDGAGASGSVCRVVDVGPAAQEILIESGWTVRWAAVRALGVVGANNPAALPPLLQALRDEEWQVRGIAVLAIGHFH